VTERKQGKLRLLSI